MNAPNSRDIMDRRIGPQSGNHSGRRSSSNPRALTRGGASVLVLIMLSTPTAAWGSSFSTSTLGVSHSRRVATVDSLDSEDSAATSVTGWSRQSPPLSPPARNGHSMVYERILNRYVLFGGAHDGRPLGDTWAYDPTTRSWSNMTPPLSPTPRVGHAMTYDLKSARVVMYGGGLRVGSSDETWLYDLRNNTWENPKPSQSPGKMWLLKCVTDFGTTDYPRFPYGSHGRDTGGIGHASETELDA